MVGWSRHSAERGYDVVAFELGELWRPLAYPGHVSLDVFEYAHEEPS